jgi:hypothetical protein
VLPLASSLSVWGSDQEEHEYYESLTWKALPVNHLFEKLAQFFEERRL